MTERTKLELQINQPTKLELMYDEPVTGQSRYGNYYLYAVKNEGDEFAFFAPEEVHRELQHLRRGDQATITKLAAQRGKKLVTKYVVDTGKDIEPENGKAETEIKNPIPKPQASDKYFDVMLSSYKDALHIQEELNGMVDVTRIAITLFIARSKGSLNGIS